MEPLKLEITPSLLQGAASRRLDHVLGDVTTQSRAFLQQHITQGHVRLNGQVIQKAGKPVRAGDQVEATWQPLPSHEAIEPIAADLEILFEDDDLLVLNKPQGMVVHPAPSHKGATLVHHLLSHLEQPIAEDSDRPGIVHRLDKGTSGILLVAKNREVQDALSAQFKNRHVHKQYEALVWGSLAGQGRFQSKMGRDRVHRMKMSSRTNAGRDAVTDWKAVRVFGNFTHVRLFPFTGRTHQLRVHLSESAHPIVGDPLYGRGFTEGRRRSLPENLHALAQSQEQTLLHAAQLEFTHPRTTKALCFQAARPDIFNHWLQQLEEHDAAQ